MDCSFYQSACWGHSHRLSQHVLLRQATPNDNTQDLYIFCWTEPAFDCYVVGNPSATHGGEWRREDAYTEVELNCWIQQNLGVGGLYKRRRKGRSSLWLLYNRKGEVDFQFRGLKGRDKGGTVCRLSWVTAVWTGSLVPTCLLAWRSRSSFSYCISPNLHWMVHATYAPVNKWQRL